MPVIINQELPAIAALRKENINLLPCDGYATGRILRIGILNLMPLKEMTEIDLLRLISTSPCGIEVELIETSTYRGRNTPAEHLDKYYRKWDEVTESHYDGFIITGAPVEKKDFEDVFYWLELQKIMDWTRTHATSTLYICWAALAGLYHHYGIAKRMLPRKISGVFTHRKLTQENPLLRGFDDEFLVPHSRYSEPDRYAVENHPELTILTDSPDAGIHIVTAHNGSEIYVTGHSEYSPLTLDYEYRRDCSVGIHPDIPANYYRNDDPENGEVVVRWRAHASMLFSNWINYFVSPDTPYRPIPRQ